MLHGQQKFTDIWFMSHVIIVLNMLKYTQPASQVRVPLEYLKPYMNQLREMHT